MPKPLYVETRVDAPLDRLWAHTQEASVHQRWDLRFTEIVPLPAAAAGATGPQRFRYATRVLPFLTVSGTGLNAGERLRPDGGCTSALRFTSDHPLSLIAEGSGYWRYQPTDDDVRFLTGYDYRARWGRFGRALDAVAFRPLMGWATAWSFDRLRIWLEHGVPPERSRNRALVELAARLAAVAAAFVLHPALGGPAVLLALVLPPRPTTPAARRCRRTPPIPIRAPRIAATLQESR